MGAYAAGTTVSEGRSREEILDLLESHNAKSSLVAKEDDVCFVAFRLHGRLVKFVMPSATENDVRMTDAGRQRTGATLKTALAAEQRRRWRALLLMLKAKFEAVESGIVDFDQEFLSHMVLPGGGHTVYEEVSDTLKERYLGHESGPLLQIGDGK